VVQDGEQFRPRLRELVEQVIVDEKQIVIKVRHAALLSEDFASRASEEPGTGTIELTTAVDFKRRGVETKVVLPGLAQPKRRSPSAAAIHRLRSRCEARLPEWCPGST